MSAVLKPEGMTREAFLAWDTTQEGRFEYDGEGPVAMVGGTVAHDLICGNLYVTLWQSLRGRPCHPYTANLRIEVAGRLRYPDVTVSCSAGTVVTGAEAVLELPEIDVSLRLGDLYEGVVFGEAAPT